MPRIKRMWWFEGVCSDCKAQAMQWLVHSVRRGIGSYDDVGLILKKAHVCPNIREDVRQQPGDASRQEMKRDAHRLDTHACDPKQSSGF